MNNIFFKFLAISTSALAIMLTLSFAIMAWTEPGTGIIPPGGTMVAPLNTGTTYQTKTGGLNIVGKVGIGTTGPSKNLEVNGDTKSINFCLGDACCSTWDQCKQFAVCTAGATNGGCLKCNADGSGWTDNCSSGQFCVNGTCRVCPPGTVKNCMTCKDDGSGWMDTCPSDQFCLSGTCQVKLCVNECFFAGAQACNGNVLYTCAADATGCLKTTKKTCTYYCYSGGYCY